MQKPLSEIATVMDSFPQVFKNVRTETKIDIKTLPGFQDTVHKLEKKLGKTGRILVRPSGTEPVIRVIVVRQDEFLINRFDTLNTINARRHN